MTFTDVVSTDDLPVSQRIEYWNGRSAQAVSPSVCDVAGAQPFSGRIRRTQLDQFGVSEVIVSPSIVRHTGAHVSRTSQALFSLKLQIEGDSVMRQNGREANLGAGDFTLCDSLRPYEMVCTAENRMLVLAIPGAVIRRHIAAPEKLTAVAMSGSSGTSALLSNFLLSLWRQFPDGTDPVVTPHIGQATLNLLASAYACRGERSSMGAYHRWRIWSYVERHLADPELTPARVAEACRIKMRYVRKLFAEEEETLLKYILRRRLEECARNLGADVHRGITQIAFAWGFSNVTYFGRVFKERYGLTPSEFRARSHSRG